MQVIVNDLLHNRETLAYDGAAGFSVGSDPANQVALTGSRLVAAKHFTVDRAAGGWKLTVNANVGEVIVNDAPVSAGEQVPLTLPAHIALPSFLLVLQESEEVNSDNLSKQDREIKQIRREIHQKVIARLDLRHEGESETTHQSALLLKISAGVDEIIKKDYFVSLSANSPLRLTMLKMAVISRLQERRKIGGSNARTSDKNQPGYNLALERMLEEYDRQIIGNYNQNEGAQPILEESQSTTIIVRRVKSNEDKLQDILRVMPENLQMYLLSSHLKKFVTDLIFGLGPLQQLLDMDDISEIMVVSPKLVYIEQDGRMKLSTCTFLDDAELTSILERIVSPLGRRIDRSSPIVDARLPDGSRVNAVIPPLALKGPCLTIRRFPAEKVTYNHLLKWGSITESAVELLRGLVQAKKNIIVAGGTGSGKTTMLNVIAGFIPESERLVTIEDSAELQLPHDHLVSLETRPANTEGEGAITIRDLIKNALRMRPDRIIVGECRGGEAFDMLQAMNTGHSGSMTTLHANSSKDVLSRLESMCLTALEIPLTALRRQIAQAIDFVVYLERLPNGQRLTTAIAEIGDIEPDGEISMRLIMTIDYDEKTQKYHLINNGYLPQILPELAARKLVDLAKIFG